MSEPILERLSRFTPDAGRLDRDALLFAAGRSSARPNRGWKTLATLLAEHPGPVAGPPPAASEPAGRRTLPGASPRCPSRPRPPILGPPRRWIALACGRRHGLLESETQTGPSAT